MEDERADSGSEAEGDEGEDDDSKLAEPPKKREARATKKKKKLRPGQKVYVIWEGAPYTDELGVVLEVWRNHAICIFVKEDSIASFDVETELYQITDDYLSKTKLNRYLAAEKKLIAKERKTIDTKLAGVRT